MKISAVGTVKEGMLIPPMRPRFPFALSLTWLLAAVSVLPSCRRDETAAGPPRGGAPVPVLTGQAQARDVPVVLHVIGRVSTQATVSVKPQVTGRIIEIHFQEGQDVQAGDRLITIDPEPFEVALAQARASLDQSNAVATNANAQVKRYTSLDKGGGVSKEQIDQIVVEAKKAAAEVAGAQAAVQKAELELGYCTLRAPISGRTGRFLVTAGNVITANQTDLVVIHQLTPIDVTFSLPERNLPAIQQGLAGGPLQAFASTATTAVAAVGSPAQAPATTDPPATDGPPTASPLAEGTLRFLDNSVNPNTLTIDLKASFPNDPPILWPGQFVNLALEVSVERDALTVPASAIQAGQTGPFVFVVTPEQTVEVRPITLGRTVGTLAVVTSGVADGEIVVTDGQSRLAKGSKVVIKKSLEDAARQAITATTGRNGP